MVKIASLVTIWLEELGETYVERKCTKADIGKLLRTCEILRRYESLLGEGAHYRSDEGHLVLPTHTLQSVPPISGRRDRQGERLAL